MGIGFEAEIRIPVPRMLLMWGLRRRSQWPGVMVGGWGRKGPKMKVLEFQTQLNPDCTLTVPPSVAQEIRAEEPVRVVLLVPDAAEDRDWAALTTEQFLRGYSDCDAIYDELGTSR
jgi:hypothetical protein